MQRDNKPKWKILAVDDEPILLELMAQIISNDACVVETATSVALAWDMLSQPGSDFSMVILDRLMPGMDGLELLRRIKADSRLAALPVVIQSAATSSEQISEGIDAGAFYYLTKPFVPKALQCIVRSVMADIELREEVSAQTARYTETLKLFTSAELRFSTLEDVSRVAGVLASMCPEPDTVSSGLVELLLNAVEHGNLGISYDEKKQLMFEDRWEDEVRHRLTMPEYAGLNATVSVQRGERALAFRITDQGKGFDWTDYLDIDPKRSLDPNGRGIAMSRRFSFASVDFEGVGNVVKATVLL